MGLFSDEKIAAITKPLNSIKSELDAVLSDSSALHNPICLLKLANSLHDASLKIAAFFSDDHFDDSPKPAVIKNVFELTGEPLEHVCVNADKCNNNKCRHIIPHIDLDKYGSCKDTGGVCPRHPEFGHRYCR